MGWGVLGQGKNGWRVGVKTTEVKGCGDPSLNKILSGSGRNRGSKRWGRFSQDLGMEDVLRMAGDGKEV